ncbi:hypothetical protein HPB48_012950 [Haemaphysalis longicornis]|uniref:Uncharacterized protein n=1 Tax=Haemaphysalis longicornis TaxID=44386 RepID=A0A9J6GJH4_HAELO|nr:hypothetical protein HPB48_012950 [Haemaphysalis longicornis]
MELESLEKSNGKNTKVQEHIPGPIEGTGFHFRDQWPLKLLSWKANLSTELQERKSSVDFINKAFEELKAECEFDSKTTRKKGEDEAGLGQTAYKAVDASAPGLEDKTTLLQHLISTEDNWAAVRDGAWHPDPRRPSVSYKSPELRSTTRLLQRDQPAAHELRSESVDRRESATKRRRDSGGISVQARRASVRAPPAFHRQHHSERRTRTGSCARPTGPEASKKGGKKGNRKSQAGGAKAKSVTAGSKNGDAARELRREREKTRQLELQVELARMNAGAPDGAVAGDASARKENALRSFSKMLCGAIPKFPSDAEVPVWFDTVECLFQRYGVPQEIQAHLVYPLVARRGGAAGRGPAQVNTEPRQVALRDVARGNEWFRATAIADLLAVHDSAEESHATLHRKNSRPYLHPQGAAQRAGKREGRFPLGKQGSQATSQCHKCGGAAHPPAECPKSRDGPPDERRVQRVATAESTQPHLLAAKVASVSKSRPELPAVEVACGSETLRMVVDSGSEITVLRESRVPTKLVKRDVSITLVAAFGNRVSARLVTLPLALIGDSNCSPIAAGIKENAQVLCALTDKLAAHTDGLLSAEAWELLQAAAQRPPGSVEPPAADSGGAAEAQAMGENTRGGDEETEINRKTLKEYRTKIANINWGFVLEITEANNACNMFIKIPTEVYTCCFSFKKRQVP